MYQLSDTPSGLRTPGQQGIEIRLWQVYILRNRTNLLNTLSAYSLESKPRTGNIVDEDRISYRFLMHDWEKTIKPLLNKNSIPFETGIPFIVDVFHRPEKKKVYLVEDDLDILFALNIILEDAGYDHDHRRTQRLSKSSHRRRHRFPQKTIRQTRSLEDGFEVHTGPRFGAPVLSRALPLYHLLQPIPQLRIIHLMIQKPAHPACLQFLIITVLAEGNDFNAFEIGIRFDGYEKIIRIKATHFKVEKNVCGNTLPERKQVNSLAGMRDGN